MLRSMHTNDDVPYAAGLELALGATGEAWVTVRGRSMLPFIWPGARLRVVCASCADVAVGDVVVMVRGVDPVIHRVVRIEGGRVITRGDAYPHDDVEVMGERLVARVSGLGIGRGSLPMPTVASRAFGVTIARHGVEMLGMLVPTSRVARTFAYRVRRAVTTITGRRAPEFEIRAATAADASALASYARERGMSGRMTHTGMSIAVHDGRVVGSVRLDPRCTTHERLLLDLFVAPSCRGYGVGERLMHHIVGRAARLEGVSAVVAEVRRGNPSRRCVERAGFTRREDGPMQTWILAFGEAVGERLRGE